jgi:hypothetical protein
MVYVQLRVVGEYMIVKDLLEIHKLSVMDHECRHALDFSKILDASRNFSKLLETSRNFSKLLKRRSVAFLIVMVDV